MTLHAVWKKPSERNVILLALLMLSFLLHAQASRAATLGMVTAIDRAAGELSIDGQVYRVDSFSKVKQTNAAGEEEVAAWYSLNIGDYLIFDVEGNRIKSLRREAPDSLDLPARQPLKPGADAVEGR